MPTILTWMRTKPELLLLQYSIHIFSPGNITCFLLCTWTSLYEYKGTSFTWSPPISELQLQIKNRKHIFETCKKKKKIPGSSSSINSSLHVSRHPGLLFRLHIFKVMTHLNSRWYFKHNSHIKVSFNFFSRPSCWQFIFLTAQVNCYLENAWEVQRRKKT